MKLQRLTRFDNYDRISELPEHLQHQILSYLPAKDAVRTSILSKAWNSTWKSFPFLDFNQATFVQNLHRTRFCAFQTEHEHNVGEFCNYVDKSIACCRQVIPSVVKFHVAVTFLDGKRVATRLDRWVHYALENNVKDLVIDQYDFNWVQGADKDELRYVMPQPIFSAKFIQNLKLSGCRMIMMNPNNNGLGCSLTKIWLSHVYINEETLEKVVSNCCLLEELGIESCEGFEVVRVHCPKLRIVDLYLCYARVQIVGIEAPNLVSMSFRGRYGNFEGSLMASSKFKNNLKELKLCHVDITYDQLNRFIGEFSGLKRIKLEKYLWSDNVYEWMPHENLNKWIPLA